MIRAFHAFSTLLLMTAVGLFLYNLIWQYATTSQIKVVSIQELWTSFDKQSFENTKTFVSAYIPGDMWSLIAKSPAAIVLLIIAGIFYLPTRLLMLLGVGKKKQLDWRQ